MYAIKIQGKWKSRSDAFCSNFLLLCNCFVFGLICTKRNFTHPCMVCENVRKNRASRILRHVIQYNIKIYYKSVFRESAFILLMLFIRSHFNFHFWHPNSPFCLRELLFYYSLFHSKSEVVYGVREVSN